MFEQREGGEEREGERGKEKERSEWEMGWRETERGRDDSMYLVIERERKGENRKKGWDLKETNEDMFEKEMQDESEK